jgi:hypothetical protein
MFEIKPSSEFSAWFESLSPAVAEEVACALDVLAAAGTALGPARASRALLWFDGTGGGIPVYLDRLYEAAVRRHTSRLGGDAQELLLWQREIVRCLESEAFRARLAELEPKAASLVLTTVENLKRQLLAARTRLVLEAQPNPLATYPRGFIRPLSLHEERWLGVRFGAEEQPETSRLRTAKEAFFEVLRLVGIEPTQIMNSASGLCELTIASTEPRLRVLFGLDAPAQRIVLLLGEPLTRAYYGDSVKLAEQLWREYCSSDLEPLEAR